jgi:hypothetical protein
MLIVKVKKLFLDYQITMTEMAYEMGKRLGRNYSVYNLSNKLRKETISYKEMELIADILSCNLEFVPREK